MKHKFLREKRNRFKIIAIFALLLLVVGYACREEFEDSEWERTEAPKLIDDAKTWYESNKPQTIGLRSSNGEQFMMKAEWTNAFATQSENYTIVETNLMSQGRLLYVDDSCKVKYEETNDPKYMQCYTRIVFRTDRKTNETVGFLMTVVPNLEWLEKSNFKPFRDVTYLYRSKYFGGMLLFHEMDGRFSNGWTYKDGKVVASIGSMDADSSQLALRSTVCDIVGVPNYQTDCVGFSTVNEDGSYNDFLTCSPVLVGYTYSSYCYDDGTGSGSNNNSDPPGYTDGSGGGGSGSNTSGGVTPNPTVTNVIKGYKLDATGMAALNTAFMNLMQNSTYKSLYNWAMQNGIKFNIVSIDPSIIQGGYDPNTENLTFISANAINQSLPEEFIHLIQDHLYPNGIAQYMNTTGEPNIEFEAKLLQDIECEIYGGVGTLGCNFIGGSDSEYNNWIDNLTNYGKTFPSLDNFWDSKNNTYSNQYSTYLNSFIIYAPSYNTPIINNLQPYLFQLISNDYK